MVERFNPPTRDQLARVSQGDERLMRALEELFRTAGRKLPDQIDVLDTQVNSGASSRASAMGLDASIDALYQSPAQWGRTASNLNGKQGSIKSLELGQLVFVSDKYDFPEAIAGVITLEDNVIYFITSHVDLDGDRIISGMNTVLEGGSSESCSIFSTGLSGTAILTGDHTVTIKGLTIEADVALDLDGIDTTHSVELFGVTIKNCPNIGTLKNYSTIIGNDIKLTDSSGLVLDGVNGTVAFDDIISIGLAARTTISVAAAATISQILRIIYSEFDTPATGTTLDVDVSAIIPVEGYEIDASIFTGAGARIVGVQHNDNKALFTDNKGISNSNSISSYFMLNNATATTFLAAATPVKILGTTADNPITQRFTNTNNRATYTGVITRNFKMTVTATPIASNGVQMAMYVAINGVVIPESVSKSTGNPTNRADTGFAHAIAVLNNNDYIEIWIENTSGTGSITVEDLVVIVEVI